jgi:RHS repeat-associated protein
MERDEETGLNYHGARFYAGWLGRWCSTDPIGISGGVNLYSANQGNPIKLIDTEGLDPTDTEESGTTIPVRTTLNNPPAAPKILPDTASDMQKAILNDSPNSQYTPEELERIEFNKNMASAASSASQNEAELGDTSVGPPGAVESLIPVWGSGRSGIDQFQKGNYSLAVAYGALAVTDVFLLKSIVVAGLKVATKDVATGALREANEYMLRNFAQGSGTHLVHFTSPSAFSGIISSGKLGGRWGLYALDVATAPTTYVGKLAWKYLGAETLLGRVGAGTAGKDLTKRIGLQPFAEFFARPPRFGVYSSYRYYLGVRSSPLGVVDFGLGKFLPGQIFKGGEFRLATRAEYASAVFHQWLVDYGIDALLYTIPKATLWTTEQSADVEGALFNSDF